MKKKFAVLFKNKSPLKVVNLEIPKPKNGQVLVKLKYTSICRSQLMEIEGLRGKDKWLPHLLGHEGSGIVVETGNRIKYFKKGDRVLISWINTEGLSSDGAKYTYQNNVINSGSATTFSQYSIISENKLIKLPKYISFKDATFYGCAIPTGFGMIINNRFKNNKKSKILLIGLGGIGLSSLICLKLLNYYDVSVLDTSKKRIKKLVDTKVFKNFKFFSNKNKLSFNHFDAVVEAAGSIQTIELAMKFIHDRGKVIFASHPDSKKKIKINPHDLIRGKQIKGTWGGGIKSKDDFKKIFQLTKNNKKLIALLDDKIYKLENINMALKDFKCKKVIRPIIKF